MTQREIMDNRIWNIREASSQRDWEDAMALLYEVFVGEGFSPGENAREWFRRASIEGNGEFLVGATSDGDIVGTVLLVDAASPLRQIASEGEAEIRLLAVDRAARGWGVGRGLVQECIDRAKGRGAGYVVLSTQPTMLTAQRLYESLGFRREAERDWIAWGYSPRLVYTLTTGEDH